MIDEHNKDDAAQDRHPEQQRPPAEPYTFALDAAESLERLNHADLSYREANHITHRSLHSLIGLQQQLRYRPDRFSEEGRELLSQCLPFGDTEVRVLTGGVDFPDTDSDAWYESLGADALVLVEQWRQCLQDLFHEDNWYENTSRGNLLIYELEETWPIDQPHPE
jgi:hypothetical protein